MPKPTYDTTLARIAGNIMAGMVGTLPLTRDPDAQRHMAIVAVDLARHIVAQVRATEPETP